MKISIKTITLLLLIAPLTVSAQTLMTTVRGTVGDPDGAVADASVSFISHLTGDTATAVTDKSGDYTVQLQLFPSGVERDLAPVRHPHLRQNYPNPFNPSTVIPLQLTAPSEATLAVFNMLGQEVTVLFRGTLAAGSHTFRWDGRDQSGHGVPAGLYICRLTTPDFSESRKMVLIDGNVSPPNFYGAVSLAKTVGESAFKIVIQKEAFVQTAEEQFVIDSRQSEVQKNIIAKGALGL